jgi:carbonic anhydrase
MTPYDQIFENNRKWAAERKAVDPDFFKRLARDQHPAYLYIGCSDSRVSATEITGLEPGEVFVHRNVANLVNSTDLNVMSVINYAVRRLEVQHVVVCGHYGCGGVQAALQHQDMGILNPWLRTIRDVYRLHKKELNGIADPEARYRRLVELNVLEQCINIAKTAAVQQRFIHGGFPRVHGWVFDLAEGQLIDLKIDFEAILKEIQQIYNLTDQPLSGP